MKNAKPTLRPDSLRTSGCEGASDWVALRALTDDEVEAAAQSDDDEDAMVVTGRTPA